MDVNRIRKSHWPTPLVIVGFIAGAVLFTTPASGATIIATFHDVSPSQSLSYIVNGNPASTVAGRFNWTRLDDPLGGDWDSTPVPGQDFFSFCIELVQTLALGNDYTYTVADLEDAPIPDNAPTSGPMGVVRAADIFDMWSAQIIFGLDITGAWDWDNATHVAAMQTAIWEIVHDTAGGAHSLAAGNFQATTVAPFVTLAQTFLDALGTHGPPLSNLKAMASESAQDQTFVTLASTSVEIPTPLAFGLGLPVILGFIGRRQTTHAA